MAPEELELLGRFLFSDQVVEDFSCRKSGASASRHVSGDGRATIEVLPRPGVTDVEGQEALRAAREMGILGLDAASVGMRWEIEGEGFDPAFLDRLAASLLANPLVERWSQGEIEPLFLEGGVGPKGAGDVLVIDIASLDDAGLAALSRERRAALDLSEMRAIKEHFAREGRGATDIEFEMIAQTWSEHCVHKTFKALVEVDAPGDARYPKTVDSVFSTYIRKPTEEIAAPWVLSAFVDNAGVIAFDDDFEVSFKVETHNHPSAVEPFGGANTGLGGVIRDIMGVSARPVASTDVLCFGPGDLSPDRLPAGTLHPRLVARGVIAGIEDYGNKMGIPTINGGLCFHEGYTSNPLVYCGCVGLAPRGLRASGVEAGDRVIAIGGKTGRDGIRGATFSSMSMDAATGEVAGASVQIGDPITQKKALDVLLAARDRGLYHAVTDCGAGGFSSAIGEMASDLGVDLELSAIGTKYPGLAPWELWLSEAQERMVLAVPPGRAAEIRTLCELYGADVYDLGFFSGTGRIVARFGGDVVLDLSAAFLREGLPRKTLRAAPSELSASRDATASDASSSVPPTPREALLRLLGKPGLSSAEAVVRRYDHEVQGGTLLAPFDGPHCDAPQDAAVIVPQGTSGAKALAIGNGFRPTYAALDPYNAAISAHDECLRNLVAVGADPGRVAVLDNFCLGDPGRPEVMWDLLESARACRDAALEHRTPFISGKDSFYNEYAARDGSRRAVPPSLLVSGMGIVPSPGKVPGSWLKAAGGRLYLVGPFEPRFGGGAYAAAFGCPAGSDGRVPGKPEGARAAYAALHAAIAGGLVAAAHDLSEGGLAAALAEMCMGGGLGIRVYVGALGRGRGFAEILFGETNGCIVVEVGESATAPFEKAMAGSPAVPIGRVLDRQILTIEADGGEILEATVGELLGAWKGPAEVAA